MSTKQIGINALVSIGLTMLLCESLAYVSGFIDSFQSILVYLPVTVVVALSLSYGYRNFKNAFFYTCWGSVFGSLGGLFLVSLTRRLFPYLNTGDFPAILVLYSLYIGLGIVIGISPRILLRSKERPIISAGQVSVIGNNLMFPSAAVVTKAYQRQFDNPIILKAGETVPITKQEPWEDNPAWMWYWGENAEGKGGWIPESYLAIDGDQGTAKQEYSAWEMTVSVGETLTLLGEAEGWYWARNETGELGWVPISSV